MQISACYFDSITYFAPAQSYSNAVFLICPCDLHLRGEFQRLCSLFHSKDEGFQHYI
jgi:hypothetical protein